MNGRWRLKSAASMLRGNVDGMVLFRVVHELAISSQTGVSTNSNKRARNSK